MNTKSEFLGGYVPEPEFCQDLGISPRTSRRYRDQGLEYTTAGGQILIHPDDFRKFLESRKRQRNPKRRAT
jgi:hypothetical protein